MFYRLGFGGGEVQLARYGDIERRAAPLEHAREFTDMPIRDGEGRTLVTDRNDDVGGIRSFSSRVRNQRPKQSESFEIDPNQTHSGLFERHYIAIDQIAIGDHEKNATDEPPSALTLSLSC